ncbi:MAG: tryptophan-rich sensory protein [Ignavibacteriae bacterium]|nr:tryptophan-rich sensory protein [Ignavibacteriota bacterium]
MKWIKLIVSLALPQIAGIIGSLFTIKSIPAWYAALNKPAINPPNWIFGPVWITLYVMMGISFYLIWIKKDVPGFGFLFSVFIFQLILNALWSIIFFGLKSPGFAFLEIIFLWLAILMCIIFFYKVSKTASLLLLPYLLWVSFASALNYFLWQMN